MKVGIIISQIDPETVWNAFRFGNFSLGKGHSVKIFLIGKGVEYETIDNIQFGTWVMNDDISKEDLQDHVVGVKYWGKW